MRVRSLSQPEVDPVHTFYAYYCQHPEYQPLMLGLQSFLNIDEARVRASQYATENGFRSFILMTAREIVDLDD